MAFVNKQSGDEAAETTAGAGRLLDFDPNDPDTIKVHYDVSAWSFDQRAELSEALADADLPHVWDGDEVIVPEEVEAEVDALFEELEAVLGPFAVLLDADADHTRFALDDWSHDDRRVLSEALIASEVPHRWEGTTVFVARDAQDAVDDLLDAIESGELLSSDDSDGAPDGALGKIFVAADRLAKDPSDSNSRNDLVELHPQLDPRVPPYGMGQRPWALAVNGVGELLEVLQSGTDGIEAQSAVIDAAQQVRSVLRPYV